MCWARVRHVIPLLPSLTVYLRVPLSKVGVKGDKQEGHNSRGFMGPIILTHTLFPTSWPTSCVLQAKYAGLCLNLVYPNIQYVLTNSENVCFCIPPPKKKKEKKRRKCPLWFLCKTTKHGVPLKRRSHPTDEADLKSPPAESPSSPGHSMRTLLYLHGRTARSGGGDGCEIHFAPPKET